MVILVLMPSKKSCKPLTFIIVVGVVFGVVMSIIVVVTLGIAVTMTWCHSMC